MAPVEEKQTIEVLKNIPTEEKCDEVFEQAKDAFDAKLAEGKALDVAMIEIPQKFVLKSITDEEFDEMLESHQYGRYVGKHLAECKMRKRI